MAMKQEIFEKYYTFNPAYMLRNDVSRTVLVTADDHSLKGLDVDDVITLIHPVYAMLLSFFNGRKRLSESVSDASEFFNVSEEDIRKIISKMLDNENDIGVEYDNNFFYLPSKLLIERQEWMNIPLYQPGQFDIDCDVDLKSKRLNIPVYMSLLVNNRCRTDCIYCYADKRRIYDCTIPFGRLQEIIAEARSIGIVSFDLQGGELFLYPEWDMLLKELFKAGYTVYISTKYPLTREEIERLKEAGVEEIQISLDSIYADDLMTNLRVEKVYRDKILAAVSMLDAAGISMKMKSVITSPIFNLGRLEEYIRYFNQFENVKIVELTAPARSLYKSQDDFEHYRLSPGQIKSILGLAKRMIANKEVSFELRTDIPEPEKNQNESPDEKRKVFLRRSQCSGNMTSFMVLPNGDVTICEEAYFNKNLCLGNILHTSIMDMWNSEKARGLFYIPQSAFPKESPCSACPEFKECRYGKGVCWTEAMAAYGEDNWMFPVPSCPHAPSGYNDILIW